MVYESASPPPPWVTTTKWEPVSPRSRPTMTGLPAARKASGASQRRWVRWRPGTLPRAHGGRAGVRVRGGEGWLWGKTGGPQGEPLWVGEGGGVGVMVRAGLTTDSALGRGEGPGWPSADSSPWRSPIWPPGVKQSDAEWPRA